MTAVAVTPGIGERVPWTDAVARMDWRQGEHVTLIGPTGVGKTELMTELLRLRRWCIFLNTKRIDPTQAVLKRELGFRSIRRGTDVNPDIASRYIIAPDWSRKLLRSGTTDAHHASVFRDALTRAFWQTGWTVAIDELEYINRDLRIDTEVNRLLRQGRSQKNSMILGTQRPRHVTLHAYEQATHLFLWRAADLSNVARAAELAGVNRAEVMDIVPKLPRHDALYVNTVTGDMLVTNTRA